MKMGGIWRARVGYLICDCECTEKTCTILSHSTIAAKFMAFPGFFLSTLFLKLTTAERQFTVSKAYDSKERQLTVSKAYDSRETVNCY
jgi:hypothetical protein